jgi:hypothetical protein
MSPNGVLCLMLRRPVSVVELAGYRRRADELLTADERDAVIDLVAYEPTCGDLIPGTGGLRKVRIGRGRSGKRGGARVIYYFYNEDFPILLMALYAKNEKGDLTARERKESARFARETMAQWRRR